jgi:hypothetical protein
VFLAAMMSMRVATTVMTSSRVPRTDRRRAIVAAIARRSSRHPARSFTAIAMAGSSRGGDDSRPSARKFSGAFTRRWGTRRPRADERREIARGRAMSHHASSRDIAIMRVESPETRATAGFPGFPRVRQAVHIWTSIRINGLCQRRAAGCIFSPPAGVGGASAGFRELLVSPQKFVDTRVGQ